MKRLRDLWPPAIFNHMKWFQQNLDLMRKSAKREFSQERPMPCRFCGKVIRVNMYRHVARLHLDLVQLWRCPIAWCTTWKGSPQDCFLPNYNVSQIINFSCDRYDCELIIVSINYLVNIVVHKQD